MTFRKSLLLLISLSTIAALVACSSSSHPITVSLSSVSSPLTTNSVTPITATTNDSAGVTWTLSCTTSPCGTLSTNASVSGTPINYTAPAFPTTGVVITATSVTNTAVSAPTSAITIAGPTLADGNYVFSLAGNDVANGNYYLAGAFTISGGAITAGEQDFSDSNDPDLYDQINPTGSSVTTNADGNLTITLVTCLVADCTQPDTFVGVGGTETLDGSVLPLSAGQRTFIAEFDGSATSSGELDPQDTTAAATAPSGGYAFAVSGLDFNGCPLAIGGIINVDNLPAAGGISGNGSIFDVNDCGSQSTYAGQTLAANTSGYLGPDSFGRIQFGLNPAATFGQIVFASYTVDGTHARLIEGFDGAYDSFGGTTGGVALSQGANTGTFTVASANNTYVLGLNGSDDITDVFQAAGQITPAADGTTSGIVDFNDLSYSSGSEGISPDSVAAVGPYTVDAAGAGDFTIAGITDTFATPNNFNLQVYLDGNGNALAITMDLNDVNAGFGFAQPAAAVGAFSSTSFSGPYGLDVTGWDVNFDGELDGVGPITADGTSAITGTVDLNWLNSDATYTALPVSGTFTANANGVFSDGLTGVDVTTCIVGGACSSDVFNYYLVGDASGDTFAIETDLNQLTLGYMAQQ